MSETSVQQRYREQLAGEVGDLQLRLANAIGDRDRWQTEVELLTAQLAETRALLEHHEAS